MKFGENIGYYRKKLKITQEELAERLNVSRQTVSRWETDSNYPDVEMIIRLCDIFGCDMDTLLRGDARERDAAAEENAADSESEREDAETLRAYDKHMNNFALVIALGVSFILIGVALMLLIFGLMPDGAVGIVVLLSMIAVAVGGFVFAGINHSDFMRSNPHIPDYPQEKRSAFAKKGAAIMAAATVLIILGVIALIIMCHDESYSPAGFTVELWQHFSVSVFMAIISVSVFLYVYGGIQYSKYDVKEYNRECVLEGFAEDTEDTEHREGKYKRISDTICSVIMLTATAAFLLLGFLKDLWHPAWVVFPVGGILCGICSVIFEAFDKPKH